MTYATNDHSPTTGYSPEFQPHVAELLEFHVKPKQGMPAPFGLPLKPKPDASPPSRLNNRPVEEACPWLGLIHAMKDTLVVVFKFKGGTVRNPPAARLVPAASSFDEKPGKNGASGPALLVVTLAP